VQQRYVKDLQAYKTIQRRSMSLLNSDKLSFILNEMKNFKFPWFIAGGWSIDLAIGNQTREHGDIDIVIFREHTQETLDYFNSWDIKVAIPGESRLEPCSSIVDTFVPRYCLHLFRENDFIEILLTETIEDQVIFRKERSIVMELERFIRTNPDSIPYVAPEWQLLFKSMNPRTHDEQDFQNYLHYIRPEERNWLKNSIKKVNEKSNWIDLL
jgi:hypothetical protein